MFKNYMKIILTAFFALAMIIPVFAQAEDSTDESCEFVTVSGEITNADDEFIVTDVDGMSYTIAPASAFVGDRLSEGDNVTLTGCLLPDDMTIRALSLEINEDVDENGDDEDDENNEETDENGDDADDTERGYYCDTPDRNHPAGDRLAQEFDVDYGDVMTAFCEDGYGFGEIMLAYLLANETGEDVSTYFDGEGNWGQKAREAGLNPGAVFSGRALGSPPWADDDRETGRPDHAGPPDDAGRPDHAGPPDNAGGGNGNGNGRGGGRP